MTDLARLHELLEKVPEIREGVESWRKRRDSGEWITYGYDPDVEHLLELVNALPGLLEQHKQMAEALERLANPVHTPQSEEAALLQSEVSGIASAALASLPGEQPG